MEDIRLLPGSAESVSVISDSSSLLSCWHRLQAGQSMRTKDKKDKPEVKNKRKRGREKKQSQTQVKYGGAQLQYIRKPTCWRRDEFKEIKMVRITFPNKITHASSIHKKE